MNVNNCFFHWQILSLKKKPQKVGIFWNQKFNQKFSFFGENFANFFYVTKLVF